MSSTAKDQPRKWARVLPVIVVAGVLSFLAGITFVARQSSSGTHPVTGRQIAGIATDARWMDRVEREDEEQPERALDLIGITPGLVVADVGAGSGYMTTRLARRVGLAGKVYAEDLQPALLRILETKARNEKLSNIVPVLGTEDDARLPVAVLDLAILVDVYHEFRQPQVMLRSIRRALKPDGRLVLLEYRKEDPDLPIAPLHKMTVADVRTEVEPEGFFFDLVNEQLPRQHIIVFRKPGSL
jgi:SAM-dependent methyltransferase